MEIKVEILVYELKKKLALDTKSWFLKEIFFLIEDYDWTHF